MHPSDQFLNVTPDIQDNSCAFTIFPFLSCHGIWIKTRVHASIETPADMIVASHIDIHNVEFNHNIQFFHIDIGRFPKDITHIVLAHDNILLQSQTKVQEFIDQAAITFLPVPAPKFTNPHGKTFVHSHRYAHNLTLPSIIIQSDNGFTLFMNNGILLDLSKEQDFHQKAACLSLLSTSVVSIGVSHSQTTFGRTENIQLKFNSHGLNFLVLIQ